MLIRPIAAVALTAFALSACAPGPWLDKSRLKDDLDAKTDTTVYPVQPITAAVIMEQYKKATAPTGLPKSATDVKHYDYHIGPQDILTVIVWDHPELMGGGNAAGGNADINGGAAAGGVGLPPVPAPTGGTAAGDANGHRVASDGTIFFPYVGRISVAGKTPEQVRVQLTHALAKTIKNPQVEVRVSAYRSQQVQITGEVKNPGTLAINDVPLTLVDALARAGSTLPTADTHLVHLTRDGKTYTINADALLDKGDVSQNVLLKAGDIVNVPDRADDRVFVLGEVIKPASVPMTHNGLKLADAITAVNSIDPKAADPRQIYVIRGAKDNPTAPKVFRLDMTQIDALLLQTQFQLQPLDVVYVGTASSTRFNRVLGEITPIIQTIFYTSATIRNR